LLGLLISGHMPIIRFRLSRWLERTHRRRDVGHVIGSALETCYVSQSYFFWKDKQLICRKKTKRCVKVSVLQDTGNIFAYVAFVLKHHSYTATKRPAMI